MRRIDSCIVIPAEETKAPSTANISGDDSSSPYKVGSTSPPKQTLVESWPCTSADLLTLEKGFALDTCWIFQQYVPACHLKASLALLLREYRPFAGRYDEWTKSIRLTDEGVTFEVFEDDDNTLDQAKAFHHTKEFAGRYIDDASSILGYRLLNHALMRVRLTYLVDGACILSVRATHGLCDGDTFYSMMDRWAAIARGSSTDNAVVVWDQSQVPYVRNRRTPEQVRREIRSQGWDQITYGPAAIRLAVLLREGIWLHHKERTPAYHLSAEGIARLKLACELDCTTSGKRISAQGVTSNEALSAFVSQVLAQLFAFPDNTPCGHSTLYNWRGRLPGMSVHFAGNASSALMTCTFFAGSCLGDIVSPMNQTFEVYKTDQEEIRRHAELFLDTHDSGVTGHMADPRTLPYLNPAPTTTVTNNFARYPVYQVDFGYGKPELVVPHHCGDQVIIWPAANGDGVDLYFQGSTALRIANLNEEENTWFERELFKFETSLDRSTIKTWFDSKVACQQSKKSFQGAENPALLAEVTLLTLSPVSVSHKPTSKSLEGFSLSGFVKSAFVLPLAAMFGI